MSNTDFERLNIILAARDREFARAMDRNTRRIERFEQRSRRSLSRTSSGFDMLAKGVKRLAPVIAGAISVQAIQGAARYAKEIRNLSSLAGTGIEDFQRWAVATQTVGIGQEKLADIIKDVNDRVGDFLQTGGGPMKDFFETIAPRVGVTADQFARLSGPEALQLYVTSLQQAGLSQAEMTFYLEAMASDAAALIPLLRDGGAEMRRLGDEAAAAGRIMGTDAVEAGARLDDKMTELSDTMRRKFQKAILDNADEITNFADTAIPLAVDGLATMGSAAMSVGAEIGTLAGQIRDLAVEAESFYNGVSEWAQGAGLTASRFFGDDPSQWPAWLKTLRGTPQDRPGGTWSGSDLLRSGGRPAVTPDQALYGTTTGTGLTSDTWSLPPGVVRPSASGTTTRPTRGGGGGGGGGSRGSVAAQAQEYRDFAAVLALVEENFGDLGGTAGQYQDILGAVDQLHADGILSADQYRDAVGQIEDEFQGVIRTAENLRSTTENLFVGMATGAMTAREAAQNLLGTLAQMAAQDAFGALLGGSGIFDTVASWFPNINSYDGGGYTGNGARSGGLDGKGGRLAMIHPRETIIDHTKGQAARSGGGVTVYQTNTFQTDVAAAVRAEIQAAVPQLMEAAKAAVADQARRAPNYKRAL